MSSALSITEAVNPPRAVYLDYPLGHTAGKAADPANQFAIMRDTLAAFESIDEAGSVVRLDYEWREDDTWKDYVMRPKPASETGDARQSSDSEHEDDRVERFDTPQYQTEEDAEAAEAECPSCVFLEDAK